MSSRREVILWLDGKMISCDPLEGMPVRQVLRLGRLRGFTRKEIKSARKALGVLSIEYDGEWYWRYPFEHEKRTGPGRASMFGGYILGGKHYPDSGQNR